MVELHKKLGFMNDFKTIYKTKINSNYAYSIGYCNFASSKISL